MRRSAVAIHSWRLAWERLAQSLPLPFRRIDSRERYIASARSSGVFRDKAIISLTWLEYVWSFLIGIVSYGGENVKGTGGLVELCDDVPHPS